MHPSGSVFLRKDRCSSVTMTSIQQKFALKCFEGMQGLISQGCFHVFAGN